MIGINVPIPVLMAYSFGGGKDSLFGDAHAHGIEASGSSPAARSSPPAAVAGHYVNVAGRACAHFAETQLHPDAALDQSARRKHLGDDDAADEHPGAPARDTERVSDRGYALVELLDVGRRPFERERLERIDDGAVSEDGYSHYSRCCC
jgi:hypothetical protein